MKNNKVSIGRLVILGISWFTLLASIGILIYLFDLDLLYFFIPFILLALYLVLYNQKWIKIPAIVFFITLFIVSLFLTIFHIISAMSLIPLFLAVVISLSRDFKKIPTYCKLMRERKIKFIKEHKKLCFVLIMILIVIIFALYCLIKVYRFHYIIDQIATDWNIDPAELDHISLYNFAFKKIALFAGIIFSSTFLVLKSLEKDK